jgi:hypothetical protein
VVRIGIHPQSPAQPTLLVWCVFSVRVVALFLCPPSLVIGPSVRPLWLVVSRPFCFCLDKKRRANRQQTAAAAAAAAEQGRRTAEAGMGEAMEKEEHEG